MDDRPERNQDPDIEPFRIELNGDEAVERIKGTPLEIQVGAALPGELGYYAIHNDAHSIIALVDGDAELPLTVWVLQGGTKADREASTERGRAVLMEAAGK
jgi:hypothetical protein